MNRERNNQTTYLETLACSQANRIGELEAALLYVLNLRDHGHNPDKVYIQATRALHREFSYSQETQNHYNRLINGI